PFLDLKSQYKEIKKEFSLKLAVLMERGNFILGDDVAEFEKNFAQYCGAKYAIGVNSGTDALFLALLSLGIGQGDEVIVPVYTYIATAFAVSYTGAKPVFADIDEKTFNMDPGKIERLITKRTKAIMPVHLYGQTADMTGILKVAKKHGLKVIEDAAQAHGSEFEDKKAGSLGDIGCFSFYPTKNLGAMGDAGLLTTDNARIFERLKKLRDYGRTSRYEHDSLGYNSRLDSIQALFLNLKLNKLDAWNEKRIRAAGLYDNFLSGSAALLPERADNCKHIYHIYAVRVKNRDKVLNELRAMGINAAVHYPVPLHLQKVYQSLCYKKGDFPIAEKISQTVLCLPVYPHIKEKEIRYVSEKLKGSIKNG
ncbi:MAG TPA: DegT/DnrJ/EryC1/StrS family aminotransferase, partial [Candidatus Omnitrophota bacterium]|nr:DegT/DnrJ/EryC1/StrS family aminotransferase [Candidatus Omnitrophota bacterium]